MRWIGIWRRKLPNFWRILTMLLRYRGLCTTSVATRERSKFRISNVQVSTGLRFKSFSATLLRKCRWVWLTSCNKNMQWKYLARPKNELVLELQHFRWTRSVWQNLANQLTRYTYVYIYIYMFKYLRYTDMFIRIHISITIWVLLISTASPYDSMKFVEVTTGHYSSERVALLFKPGTYAAGSEKADCFGGLLLAVVFSLFFSKVFKGWGFLFF